MHSEQPEDTWQEVKGYLAIVAILGFGFATTFAKRSRIVKLESLKDLLEELKELYDAEKRIVKALPKSASSPQLRKAFSDHLEKNKAHLHRLEQIFRQHDIAPPVLDTDLIEGQTRR